MKYYRIDLLNQSLQEIISRYDSNFELKLEIEKSSIKNMISNNFR